MTKPSSGRLVDGIVFSVWALVVLGVILRIWAVFWAIFHRGTPPMLRGLLDALNMNTLQALPAGYHDFFLLAGGSAATLVVVTLAVIALSPAWTVTKLGSLDSPIKNAVSVYRAMLAGIVSGYSAILGLCFLGCLIYSLVTVLPSATGGMLIVASLVLLAVCTFALRLTSSSAESYKAEFKAVRTWVDEAYRDFEKEAKEWDQKLGQTNYGAESTDGLKRQHAVWLSELKTKIARAQSVKDVLTRGGDHSSSLERRLPVRTFARLFNLVQLSYVIIVATQSVQVLVPLIFVWLVTGLGIAIYLTFVLVTEPSAEDAIAMAYVEANSAE
jgi:hypothetical protein